MEVQWLGDGTAETSRQAPVQTLQEPRRIEKRIVGSVVKTFFLRGRRGGPWPLPPNLPLRPASFVGNSGARLSALCLDTPAPRAVVVLAHPDRRYGKQWFAREGWLDFLHANRLAAIVFDFPAYGGSRGGSTYFHDDVLAAANEARRLHPDLPLHVVGLSIGAFAVANASPHLDADSLVLESPYPTFADWYDHASSRKTLGRVNSTMAKVWPRTARRIDAGRNIAAARAPRVLVAATPHDEVTPIALSRRVHDAAPAAARRWLEVPAAGHLELFQEATYRAALLATWFGASRGSQGLPGEPPGFRSPSGRPAQALISHLA